MCPVYLRILIQLYRTQSLRINWNVWISSEFTVSNGIKQGVVLSLLLFAVYLDDLLKEVSGMSYQWNVHWRIYLYR